MREIATTLTRTLLAGLLTLSCVPGLLLFTQGCTNSQDTYAAAGIFEATEVIVSSEATGRLLRFSIEEGDQVTDGQVVGQVDCHQLELQREQLTTRIKNLGAQIVDVATQVAPIKQQIAEAEREQRRLEPLIASGAVPSKHLDDVNGQIAVLRSQEAATVQSLTMNNSVVRNEQAAMEVQLEQINDQIHRCELKSSASGTVLVKYAQEGEFSAPGRALFKVGDTTNMFLRAYVTADQLTRMQLGQEVTVAADFGARESRSYQGKITWIATKSEFTPKTIQTRDERANQVYAIKVAVPNDGFLKIGMYGYITTIRMPPVDGTGVQQTSNHHQGQTEPGHVGN